MSPAGTLMWDRSILTGVLIPLPNSHFSIPFFLGYSQILGVLNFISLLCFLHIPLELFYCVSFIFLSDLYVDDLNGH